MIELLSNEEKKEKKLTEADKNQIVYNVRGKLRQATEELKDRSNVITEPIIPVTKEMYEDRNNLPGLGGFGKKYGDLKLEIDTLCDMVGINERIMYVRLGTRSAQAEILTKKQISEKFSIARKALISIEEKVVKIRQSLTTGGMTIEAARHFKANYEIMVEELKLLRSTIYSLGETFGLNARPVIIDDISIRGREHTIKY